MNKDLKDVRECTTEISRAERRYLEKSVPGGTKSKGKCSAGSLWRHGIYSRGKGRRICWKFKYKMVPKLLA